MTDLTDERLAALSASTTGADLDTVLALVHEVQRRRDAMATIADVAEVLVGRLVDLALVSDAYLRYDVRSVLRILRAADERPGCVVERGLVDRIIEFEEGDIAGRARSPLARELARPYDEAARKMVQAKEGDDD